MVHVLHEELLLPNVNRSVLQVKRVVVGVLHHHVCLHMSCWMCHERPTFALTLLSVQRNKHIVVADPCATSVALGKGL